MSFGQANAHVLGCDFYAFQPASPPSRKDWERPLDLKTTRNGTGIAPPEGLQYLRPSIDMSWTMIPMLTRMDGSGLAAGREWTGVVRIGDGHVNGSGVLLDSGIHILTAAHLIERFSLESGRVYFQDGTTQVSRTIQKVQAYPGASFTSTGVWHDLALLTLNQAAPVWAVRHEHNQQRDELGNIAVLVGYGSARSPEGVALPEDHASRRAGENLVEVTGASLFNYGARGSLSEHLIFDFDNGTAQHDALGTILGLRDLGLGGVEAMLTPGDSGGGMFLERDGKWVVAGIHSYVMSGGAADLTGAPDSSIGGLGASVRVSGYADWIDFQTGMAQTPQGRNDAPPPRTEVPLTVKEGEAVWFLVSLGAPALQRVSVRFETRDGTARAGMDYIPTRGEIVLEVGQQWAKVWVQTLADNLVEGEESFYLVLRDPIGAGFPAGTRELTAVRTIIDDISLAGVTQMHPELFG